ncbi:MAG: hypothetical protein NPIRA06_29380 [Nitrospirales bacterium]|nr:MAG: hypothetical protein NPIRA06_29380 [Nitrospirales bacterium]
MLVRISFIFGPLFIFAIGLIGSVSSWGQGASAQAVEAPADFVIPESIKGFDEEKVKKDPICDSSVRPQMDHVKPDEMKPGDTVVVEGKSFGKKKECLFGVTFGAEPAKAFTLVDDEHIQVVVPEGLRSGVTFLNIETGGGTARKGVLVHSKD